MKHTLCILIVTILMAQPSAASVPGFLLNQRGTLQGKVRLDDVSATPDGIILSFFNVDGGPPPTQKTVRRVPDALIRTDGEGGFETLLVPGKYHMGLLLRKKNEGPGPPRPGERFFFAVDEKGELRVFDVTQDQVTDAGVVKGASPESFSDSIDHFTVKGKVTDESGAPVEGAVILVKTDMNNPRPLFISKPTDKEGTYQVNLPVGKAYYLLARQNVSSGRPLPGSFVGTLGKSAPIIGKKEEGAEGPQPNVGGMGGEGEAMTVGGKKGEVLDNLDITMFKIPDPEEVRKLFQKESSEKEEKESQEKEGEKPSP